MTQIFVYKTSKKRVVPIKKVVGGFPLLLRIFCFVFVVTVVVAIIWPLLKGGKRFPNKIFITGMKIKLI